MKRILTYTITGILTMIGLSGFLGICRGQIYLYDENSLQESMPYVGIPTTEPSTQLGNEVPITGDNTIMSGLLKVFKLDEDKSDHKFLNYAKSIINIALGLVSFIALIMSIYTFYMMFFSENEAGIKKAKGNLIGIFIALAIIGLAWIIVSFIFWWYQENWKSKEEQLFPELATFNYENKTVDNQIYLTI